MIYAYVQDVAAAWENYERVAEALGNETPAGLVVHVAGPTSTGFRIIEVWDSQEAWERFRNERLRPAVKASAGDEPERKPVFEPLDVHNFLPQ